jgi:hypothetical protein
VRTIRAPRWARFRGAGTVAGYALLVMMMGVGCGLGLPAGAADGAVDGLAAARQAGSSPSTLGTVVIPNLGLGYTVSSQGPLNASQFAANAPNPTAAAAALSTLGKSVSTYERVWQADGGLNQVQDLLVRFPDAVGAQVFLQAAQHSLETGEIVSSDTVPSIPGARRVTYFAATNQDGVGEAITMRAGDYVDLLSIFSAASDNAHPISPANAEHLATVQHAAMARAPGGASGSAAAATAATSGGSKKGVSAGTIGLAVVVVLIAAAAVATPGLLRRRRLTQEAAARLATDDAPTPSPPPPASTSGPGLPPASAGDAVDDLREQSG